MRRMGLVGLMGCSGAIRRGSGSRGPDHRPRPATGHRSPTAPGRGRRRPNSQVEQPVQADRQPRPGAHLAHGEDDAGHEAGAVEAVRADGELLAGVAQHDLLVGGEPAQPHGVDVDPSGEYIVGNGKLSANLPVFSFTKIQDAIKNHQFDGKVDGINVIKYESALHGEVQSPGLGSLHTEFDADGNAYTSFFISSEIVKWRLKDCQIEDRIPTYYSIGHLSVLGADTKKPYGKYMVAYNKITKDCFLPTGPELCQAAQLYDISGKKMRLILEFPTIGEPHYASAIAADMLKPNMMYFTRLADNHNPYKISTAQQARVERHGNRVDIYMAAIRSRLVPDNIEGIRLGDEVYFHVTNIEQEWDIPHGFTVKGNNNAEILVMPGETCTLKWIPNRVGILPFYCTDFCSALHQEMQGYARVSPKGSNTPLSFTIDDKLPSQFAATKPTTQSAAAPTTHKRK